MLPKQSEIEVPLLRAIEAAGGRVAPRDVYPAVTAAFPEITEEDLAEELASGHSRWTNRVQWVRQKLVTRGELSAAERGVWAITDKGRRRLAQHAKAAPSTPTAAPQDDSPEAFMALYDAYDASVREEVLDTLGPLPPRAFEVFAGELLKSYGFARVTVTSVGADGGIDGHGELRVGLAHMRVAFQCKRWDGTVGRPEIDKFRGAIQGEFEQGLFFTTSSFTKQAREASIKPGAVPVVLLDGESIVRLMFEKGLGVVRRPLYVYAVDLRGFLPTENL